MNEHDAKLMAAILNHAPDYLALVKLGRYREAMGVFVALSDPVDAFFENCLVNCGDEMLRTFRLSMLRLVASLGSMILDFSKVPA